MYKFNNGRGAYVCNFCRIIIKEDVAYNDTQFHLCHKCRPEWIEKVDMDAVHSIALAAMETIEAEYKKKGIDIEANDKLWDDIYDHIEAKLEYYSTGDYNNHN